MGNDVWCWDGGDRGWYGTFSTEPSLLPLKYLVQLALEIYYFDTEASTKMQLYVKEVVQNASANTKLEIEKSKLELQLWTEDRMRKAVRKEMCNALEAKRGDEAKKGERNSIGLFLTSRNVFSFV